MVWRVVTSLAPLLSDEFRGAHEDLVKVLTGSKRSEDLWKRCMGKTDEAIGMVLGHLFIEKAFEGSSKQQVRIGLSTEIPKSAFLELTVTSVMDDSIPKLSVNLT